MSEENVPPSLERKFQELLADAHRQCDSVDEAHKRWNRVEEAIDPVCEDAIYLLDRIGRIDQAEEIQSHMSLIERFDLLVALFRDDARAVRDESKATGLEHEYLESAFLLGRFEPWVREERAKVGK